MILLLWEYSEDYPKLSLVFISKVPQLKIKYQNNWNISPIPNHNSSLSFSLQLALYGILYISLLNLQYHSLLSDKVAFESTKVLAF